MVRHLKAKHGLDDIVVPSLKIGRPTTNEGLPRSTSHRSHAQCKARFSNVDLKYRNARKYYEKSKREQGTCLWELKHNNESKEEWVTSFVAKKMREWEKCLSEKVN